MQKFCSPQVQTAKGSPLRDYQAKTLQLMKDYDAKLPYVILRRAWQNSHLHRVYPLGCVGK